MPNVCGNQTEQITPALEQAYARTIIDGSLRLVEAFQSILLVAGCVPAVGLKEAIPAEQAMFIDGAHSLAGIG